MNCCCEGVRANEVRCASLKLVGELIKGCLIKGYMLYHLTTILVVGYLIE